MPKLVELTRSSRCEVDAMTEKSFTYQFTASTSAVKLFIFVAEWRGSDGNKTGFEEKDGEILAVEECRRPDSNHQYAK